MGAFGEARRRLRRWLRNTDAAVRASAFADQQDMLRSVAELPDSMVEAAVAERMRETRSGDAPPENRVFYLDLAPVAEHFGDEWGKLHGRALLLADRVLRRRTNDLVAYLDRTSLGVTFALIDPALDTDHARALSERIIAEILRTLLGGEAPDEVEEELDDGASLVALGELLNNINTGPTDGKNTTRVLVFGEDATGVDDEAPSATSSDGLDPDGPDFDSALQDPKATNLHIEAARPTGQLAAIFGGDAEEDAAPAFGDSADLLEQAEDVLGSMTDEEFIAAWDASQDPRDAEPAVVTSGDRPTNQASLESGGETDPARDASDFTSETKGEALGDFGRTEARPEVLGSFGSTVDRDGGTGDFGASGDRAENLATLESGGDPLDAPPIAGSSVDRPVRPPLFGPSGEVARDAPVVRGGGDIAERPPLFGASESKPAPAPAEFAASADRLTGEASIVSGGDRAETEFSAGRSDDRIEGVADHGTSDEKPSEDAVVPLAGDRAESDPTAWPDSSDVADQATAVPMSDARDEPGPAEFGASRTRDDPEAVLVASVDAVAAEPGVPLSGDRADPALGDFGRSDTINDPEQAVGATDTRAERDASGAFGESGTRAAGTADFGASEDRVETLATHEASETRPDAGAVDFGATETRAEAVADFGRTEERVEREYAVATSRDRPDREYDFGRSEERLVADAPTTWTRTRDSSATISMIKTSGGPAGRINIALTYAALLDATNERVTTYLVDPRSLDTQNNAAVYFASLEDVRSEDAAFEIDCQSLAMSVSAIEPVIARGGRFILALPVSARTLLRPKARVAYVERFHRAPEAVRRMIRLAAYGTVQNMAPLQLDELLGHMRSHGRAPFLFMPPEPTMARALANRGVYGVVVDAGHWGEKLGADTFFSHLTEFARRCHAIKIRVAVQGLDIKGGRRALAAGTDYLAIANLQGADAIPLVPPRVPLSKIDPSASRPAKAEPPAAAADVSRSDRPVGRDGAASVGAERPGRGAGAAPPATNDEGALVYAAMLDTRSELVTTYIVAPRGLDTAGDSVSIFAALEEARSDDGAFAVDLRSLDLSLTAIEPVLARGGKLILGVPVAASTLLNPKARAAYGERLERAPDFVRRVIRLNLYRSDGCAGPGELDEVIEHALSLGRAPFLSLRPDPTMPATLANRGIHGVVVDGALWTNRLGAETFMADLVAFTDACHGAKARVAVHGLDRAGRGKALRAEADYIAIARLDKATAIPLDPLRISRAKLQAASLAG